MRQHQPAAGGRGLLGSTRRDISVLKRYQENADLFSSRKNATLEILSHDLRGAFLLGQQLAEFLREEVVAPAHSRVPDLLNVLATTSRDSVQMIRDLINLEFLSSANLDLKVDRGARGPCCAGRSTSSRPASGCWATSSRMSCPPSRCAPTWT